MNRRRFLGLLAGGTVGLTSGCAEVPQDTATGTPGTSTPEPTATPTPTPAPPPASGDWPMAGHDPGNTGYSSAARVPTDAPKRWWRHALGDRQQFATGPLLYEDLVLVGERGTPADGESLRLLALDAATGAVQWRYDVRKAGNAPVTPAITGGLLYVRIARRRTTTIHALDPATGSRRFRTQVDGTIQGPFAATEDVLVVTQEDGLLALNAGSGERRWTASANPMAAQPAVGDGFVVIGVDAGTSLERYDLDTGDRRWSDDLGGGMVLPPVAHDGVVYSGTADSLVAIETGAEQWTFELDRDWDLAPVAPAVDGERVYAGGGGVLAVDAADGEHVWSEDLDAAVVVRPTVAGDTLVTGQFETVTAFDAAEGTDRWTVAGPPRPAGHVAAGDGWLYVTGTDGTCYAYGPQPDGN